MDTTDQERETDSGDPEQQVHDDDMADRVRNRRQQRTQPLRQAARFQDRIETVCGKRLLGCNSSPSRGPNINYEMNP